MAVGSCPLEPFLPARPSLAWSALALMTGHQGSVKRAGEAGRPLLCRSPFPAASHLGTAPPLSAPSSTNGHLP